MTLVALSGALVGSAVTGALFLALRSTDRKTIQQDEMWSRYDVYRFCLLLARGRGDWRVDPVVVRGRVEKTRIISSGGTHTTRAEVVLDVAETLRGRYSKQGRIMLSVGASDEREFSAVEPGSEYLVLFAPIPEGTRYVNVETGEGFTVRWDGTSRVEFFLRSCRERVSLFRELLELTHLK